MTWPRDILGKETSDFFSEIEVPEKVSDPGFEEVSKAYYDRIPLFMDKICKELGTNWQYDKTTDRETKTGSRRSSPIRRLG